MKKVLKVCVCGLMVAMIAAGCSKKEDTASTSGDSVTLGNYKGVTYTPVSTEVTDEDVEAEIKRFVDSNPVITEVDRAAKEGDTVNIDYVGLKDGVAFEGGTASGFDLELGSGSFIDGFEDGLIGVTKGQEISLNLTFPAEYTSEELAGQAVVFDVTVNTVKESVPAELSDAFINDNTEYGTVEEYRESMKADMIAYAEESAIQKKKSDVFLKVIEDSQITIAEETVKAYYEDQLAVYQNQAAQAGVDLATMASMYGMTEEDFKVQLQTMAQEAMKQNAVVNAIAEKEKITVTEEDKDQLVLDFGYESKETMIENAGEMVVNNYILTEKVVTFIADHAVEA